MLKKTDSTVDKNNSLTLDDLKEVASLAKIQLTEEELELYLQHLHSILSHMAELKKIDTTSVRPLYNVISESSRSFSPPPLREDTASTSWPLPFVLGNAQETQNNQFVFTKLRSGKDNDPEEEVEE